MEKEISKNLVIMKIFKCVFKAICIFLSVAIIAACFSYLYICLGDLFIIITTVILLIAALAFAIYDYEKIND